MSGCKPTTIIILKNKQENSCALKKVSEEGNDGTVSVDSETIWSKKLVKDASKQNSMDLSDKSKKKLKSN